MNQNTVAFLPAGVLLVGVMFISGIREQHVMKPAQPLSAVTSTFEGLQGKDFVIDSAEQRVAGMSDYSYRDYAADSVHNFSVYVGYYDRQVQGKTIHSPKNCLPGAGWQVMTNDRMVMSDVPGAPKVNRVVLTKDNARALVYYWYQGRGRIEANEYRVKWDLLRDAALYGRTEEALVRIVVSLPPNRANTNDAALTAADSLVKRVATPLVQSVYKVLPPFGKS